MLTEQQKEQQVICCRRFLDRFDTEGHAFLERIVTVNGTLISLYMTEKQKCNIMWKKLASPLPKKS